MSAQLTPREEQILHMVAVGHTNRQIGLRLGISEKTVEAHLSRIYLKLGVRNRAEAVAAFFGRRDAPGVQ